MAKKNAIVPDLVARDVKNVERYAAYVITIEGTKVRLNINDPFSIGSIAVVGPTEAHGVRYQKALLCEVGCFGGRPYARSRPRKGKTRLAKDICKRRRWFSMTDEQYRLVAPLLLDVIQTVTDERIQTWKSRTFTIPFIRNRYVRSRRRVFEHERYEPIDRGLRFAVHRKDRQLCADLFATELHDPDTRHRMRGLYCSIEMLMGHYHERTIWSKRFWNYRWAEEGMLTIQEAPLPFYLMVAMFYRHFGQQHPLWFKLGEPLDWDPTQHDDPWELECARKALSGRRDRVGELKVRTIRTYRERGVAVLEVFASPGVNEESGDEELGHAGKR